MQECNRVARQSSCFETEKIINILKEKSLTLALAESCTAGLVSAAFADTSGVSSVLWGSFVCYTKEAKISMLGLDREALDNFGLVSRETACAMAEAALNKSGADIAASVTGLAGPLGDGSDVPVGTVWTAAALKKRALQGGTVSAKEFHFTGDRNEVRDCAAAAVFEMLESLLFSIEE